MGTRAPSTKARPAAVVRTPQQSVERRAGHGPVISGDPEIGPTARRVTGAAFRTSACRRSAPLGFRGTETDKGYPAPRANRAAERWLRPRRSGAEQSEEPGI